MTEHEKLILHLQNLLKSNTRKITLDVQYLLEVMNSLPNTITSTKPEINKAFNVDGGAFREDKDI